MISVSLVKFLVVSLSILYLAHLFIYQSEHLFLLNTLQTQNHKTCLPPRTVCSSFPSPDTTGCPSS